jgi:hypothetical protein
VLDADNTGLIVAKTLTEVDKLRKVARSEGEKIVRALRTKLSTEDVGSGSTGRHFDWKVLGIECGVCFNAPPMGVRFLAGSIDVEGEKVVRKKAKRQRQKNDDAEEIRPEVLSKETNKKDADALSATEKMIRKLDKVLAKRCQEELQKKYEEHPGNDEALVKKLEKHGREVDGVRFLVNPRSFTQTVENIFNYSFLVKKGTAAIGVRSPMERDEIKRQGLWVATSNPDDAVGETTQAVVSFTMKDWRRMIEAHQLKECDIPHRTGSKHERVAAVSTASQSEG